MRTASASGVPVRVGRAIDPTRREWVLVTTHLGLLSVPHGYTGPRRVTSGTCARRPRSRSPRRAAPRPDAARLRALERDARLAGVSPPERGRSGREDRSGARRPPSPGSGRQDHRVHAAVGSRRTGGLRCPQSRAEPPLRMAPEDFVPGRGEPLWQAAHFDVDPSARARSAPYASRRARMRSAQALAGFEGTTTSPAIICARRSSICGRMSSMNPPL
jgi:hypothetical protein